jgi:O-antigen/teichoic acid export membrane protein
MLKSILLNILHSFKYTIGFGIVIFTILYFGIDGLIGLIILLIFAVILCEIHRVHRNLKIRKMMREDKKSAT